MSGPLSDPVVLACIGGATVSAGVLSTLVLRMAREATEAKKEAAAVGAPTRSSARRLDAYDGSTVVQRAIEITANLAERKGLLGSVERSLRAADIPLRPAEVIFAYGVLAAVVPLSVLLFLQTPKLVFYSVLIFAVLPPMALKVMVARRRKKFAAQLPDMLSALASALRAGRSLGQAVESLAREMPSPMGRELRKISAEVRLGRKLADALADAVERVDSKDFRWAVLAMQIQAEVGGNLAELLDRVGETIRARSRLKGEVKALTAEGRASAMMLGIMPPALGLVMYTVNPTYMAPMFSESAGHVMLGISAVMIVGGFLWMRKLVTINV